MDLCAWMIPPAVAPDGERRTRVDVTDPRRSSPYPHLPPKTPRSPPRPPREPVAESRKAAPDAAKVAPRRAPASREEQNARPPRVAASDDLARAVSATDRARRGPRRTRPPPPPAPAVA